MRKTLTSACVAAGLVLVVGTAGAASDAEPAPSADVPGIWPAERPHVAVRVYDNAGLPAPDQAVALGTAASALAAAGIDARWLVCGRSDGADNPAGCALSLTHDELAVRLVRLPTHASACGTRPLGDALVETPAASGTLATVYVDRIEWLAGQVNQSRSATVRGCDGARVRPTCEGCDGAWAPKRSLMRLEGGRVGDCDVVTVIGFAVAHEVGHLLLGTTTHATTGLMRAVWSRADLERADATDWRFTTAEGLAMAKALSRRQHEAMRNR